jgi:hypothetical protein
MTLTSLMSYSIPCNYSSCVNNFWFFNRVFRSRYLVFKKESSGWRTDVILLTEESKLVVAADDVTPAPESTELNMRRGNFNIGMWQGAQEQSCLE